MGSPKRPGTDSPNLGTTATFDVERQKYITQLTEINPTLHPRRKMVRIDDRSVTDIARDPALGPLLAHPEVVDFIGFSGIPRRRLFPLDHTPGHQRDHDALQQRIPHTSGCWNLGDAMTKQLELRDTAVI